jgi:hypothetical protein
MNIIAQRFLGADTTEGRRASGMVATGESGGRHGGIRIQTADDSNILSPRLERF